MRYEKIDRTTHIYVEGGETEQQVLRSIVKASFELARPAGLGWLHFRDNQPMTDEDADHCINLPPDHGGMVIEMDYVQGRQCKTYIQKIDEGHFTLFNNSYERDRGTPEPMLDRANEIISGKDNIGVASTNYMYKGESLTLRLKEYGYTRKDGESDWDFRRRIFPDFYEQNAHSALEFLMGGSAAEWNEIDKVLCLLLVRKGKPNHHELVKFAKGFSIDPQTNRERVKAVEESSNN